MSQPLPIDDPTTTDAAPHGVAPNGAWREKLSSEEIRQLLSMNDWRSAWTLALNWGLVFASMALVAAWPNPLTVIAALFVIGARQLGMAVIMHDSAHRAFLSNKDWNDWVGSWLASYPIWSDIHSYRSYHLQHHAKTWTQDDPDLKLATPFPIRRSSLWRKFRRDLTGQTGLKFARFAIRRDLPGESLGERIRAGLRSPVFRGMLITNGTLLGLCALAGHPLVYFLWPVAYLTTNTLVTRIRAIAEHSMSPDPGSELLNTRTMLPRWWERLLIAPNRVNYHLEHHLLMMVPHYNLPKMHRMLKERGALDGALVEQGYWQMLKRASSRGEPSAA